MFASPNFACYIAIFPFLFTIVAGAIPQDELCTGCQSHCTLDFDKTLDCWNGTLHFYERVLLGNMRNYVAVQTNIARWRAANEVGFSGSSSDYWSDAASTSVEHMKHIDPLNIEDEIGVIHNSDMRHTVNALMEGAASAFASLQSSESDPSTIICPFGCEHPWNPYYWMFLVSALCNLVLGGITMALVWCLDKRDTAQARLETAECELMKGPPISNKHRPSMVIPPYETT
uniref:Transmembrane protein n=1 Tax=Panagrellus redivivus TaxID=6233 RepID=A0A7E4W0G6_PANRE